MRCVFRRPCEYKTLKPNKAMVWMGVPAALNNRLWARLRARNAVSSFMVFSKSARCSSLKGCTYLMIITSSGRGEYATQSGLTLMRYCISIVSKNFWSGTYHISPMALYRLICALGQQSLVPVLTRCGLPLPVYFLADEKHSRCLTDKVYLPTGDVLIQLMP